MLSKIIWFKNQICLFPCQSCWSSKAKPAQEGLGSTRAAAEGHKAGSTWNHSWEVQDSMAQSCKPLDRKGKVGQLLESEPHLFHFVAVLSLYACQLS